MKDFLTLYKTEILNITTFLTLPFIVFLVSLGFVYLFGRMLNLLKTATTKNITAFTVMILCYIFYFYFLSQLDLIHKIWTGIIHLSISIIFYTLLGFKLYSRVDTLLDKKLSPDYKEKVKK
jgi:amino acid transporter